MSQFDASDEALRSEYQLAEARVLPSQIRTSIHGMLLALSSENPIQAVGSHGFDRLTYTLEQGERWLSQATGVSKSDPATGVAEYLALMQDLQDALNVAELRLRARKFNVRQSSEHLSSVNAWTQLAQQTT